MESTRTVEQFKQSEPEDRPSKFSEWVHRSRSVCCSKTHCRESKRQIFRKQGGNTEDTARRWLSVSELLLYSTESDKNLFPLIDQQKYRDNVSKNSNDVELTTSNSTDDIASYFKENERKKQLIRSQSLSNRKDYKTKYKRCSEYFHTQEERKRLLDVDELNMESKNCDIIQSTSNKSEDDIVPQDLNPSVDTPLNRNNLSRTLALEIEVSVECLLEYIAQDKRLKIQVVNQGDISNDTARAKKIKLFAEVRLSPSSLQKKKMKVEGVDKFDGRSSYIYFEGYSATELQQMKMRIKFYLDKGLLRRSQMVGDWSISLGDIDFLE